VLWDGGGLGFVMEIWWNWGRTREKKKDMIPDCNPDLDFITYDSIHEIKINTESK